jgi:hypothetical protein
MALRALCMAATLWPRVALLAISTSTWRAAVWLAWSAFSGLLWADLGLEPKIKVEAREQLYTFHLEVKIIRVLY